MRSGNCGGPTPYPTTQSPNRSCKKTFVVFHSMGGHSILLKPGIPHILFLHSNELSKKILIIFCINSLFQKQWYYSLLSRHCTPNRIFEEWTAFSFIPYSTVLTINVSTQVEACFVCRKLSNSNFILHKRIKHWKFWILAAVSHSEFLQLYPSLNADRNLMSLILAVCVLYNCLSSINFSWIYSLRLAWQLG